MKEITDNFRNNSITTIDFSDDKQLRFYLSLFKNINLESDAPIFSSIINRTREQHILDKGCHYRSLLQMKEGIDSSEVMPWVDGIIVDYIGRETENNKIYGQVTVSLIDRHDGISVIVNLVYNNQTITALSELVFDENHLVYRFSCADFDPDVQIEHIEIDVVVSKVDKDQRLTAQQLKLTSYADLNVNTPVQKIAVVDPENICTNLGDAVNIAYGRGVSSGEQLDYEYASEYLNIMIPFNGYVFLKDGNRFDGYQSFRLILDSGAGTTQYNGSRSGLFESLDEGFKWHFDENWGQPIDYSIIPPNTLINLTFELVYTYYNSENRISSDTLFISGDNLSEYNKIPAFQQIPKLNFLWGCLGKDSQIRMFDTTLKLITEIRHGDVVSSNLGEKLVVRQVLKGFEKDILRVTTDDGSSMLATEAHPFLTETGVKRANSLTSEDKLIGKNGSTRVTGRYLIPYNDEVYNLTFEKTNLDTYFICNDLVVGDNDMQNILKENVKLEESSISADLRAELCLINDSFNQKQ